MGIDTIITIDIHRPEIKGFFDNSVPITDLDPYPIGGHYFKKLIMEDIMNGDPVIVSPDTTSTNKSIHFRNVMEALGIKNLGLGLVLQPNEKLKPIKRKVAKGHKVLKREDLEYHETRDYIGDDVAGRDCIVVDDMISNGGKSVTCAEVLKKYGARRVFLYSTHANFGLKAL
jgi:ribose-phosphate pyrophosphokinase